ncbi:hypothetical protein [Sphingobacterium detergens]|uniref:Uncharacterized protein n=1 Tax=Sphingobacterium detergens TaxID=1145106 RepID=A0A420BFA2_SPHD1|nr:hypothetical protein [Sphingobacterium detergens]RKE55376.1 hypothetical protein DFQ12_0207 [Sphingobacterium detergens]
MKKILNKIGQVLQVVLAAPLKLPGKAGNILKYIALGLGILETVLEKEKDSSEEVSDDADQGARSVQGSSPEQQADPPAKEPNGTDQNVRTNGAGTGERSEADEME